MFGTVEITLDAHEHFRSLVEFVVFKNVPPRAAVPAAQLVSLIVALDDLGHDVVGGEKLRLLSAANYYRCEGKKQNDAGLYSHG
jgi:hypothetical protein